MSGVREIERRGGSRVQPGPALIFRTWVPSKLGFQYFCLGICFFFQNKSKATNRSCMDWMCPSLRMASASEAYARTGGRRNFIDRARLRGSRCTPKHKLRGEINFTWAGRRTDGQVDARWRRGLLVRSFPLAALLDHRCPLESELHRRGGHMPPHPFDGGRIRMVRKPGSNKCGSHQGSSHLRGIGCPRLSCGWTVPRRVEIRCFRWRKGCCKSSCRHATRQATHATT